MNLPLPSHLAQRFDSLYQWLSRRYPLRLTSVEIAGKTFAIYKTDDIDAVLESTLDAQQEHPEASPYWAELWPSALALSEMMVDRGIAAGTQVLELGCGMGLCGIVAGSLGARVVLNDREADALRLAELNWLSNLDTAPMIEHFDWAAPPARQFELIIAADVAYEAISFLPLCRLFDQMLTPRGEIWLAEPGRPVAADFFSMLRETGFIFRKKSHSVTQEGKTSEVFLYIIRKN